MNIDRPAPAFLGDEARISVDQPFTRAAALQEGVSKRQLATWVDEGLLVNPLRGIYHVAQLPDGLELRAECLRLVAPADAVVTDETAGWFHGASMVLAPNDHLAVPRVSMFLTPGNRLRNELAASGERTFVSGEVVELHGVRVTSKLRTTCDLGMRRNRDRAFSGMDMMANVADYDLRELVELAESKRFKGYRWVRQFRELAPHVRAGAQSPPESLLRLRWIDCPALPYPRPQVPVRGPNGWYYVDVGNEDLRYGAEYYGAKWHAEEQQPHDEARREWLERQEEWTIDVFRSHNIYGPHQDVTRRLLEGAVTARRRSGTRAWSGQDRAS